MYVYVYVCVAAWVTVTCASDTAEILILRSSHFFRLNDINVLRVRLCFLSH